VLFEKNLNFIDRSSKNTEVPNFMKIVHWEPSFCRRMNRRTDGQTNTTKLIYRRLSQFC